MPHLEAMTWNDPFSVDGEFFYSITRAPLQHLKLARTPIEASYIMESPLTPASFPLRSFHLDVRSAIRPGEEDDISPFVGSFLRLCAPTLETLHFSAIRVMGKPISFSAPTFPRLRYLSLQALDTTTNVLLGFLRAPLRMLSLSYVRCRTDGQDIAVCEQIRDLETLVLPENPAAFATFLSNHTHVQKLCVDRSRPEVLDRQIIPLLSGGNFTRLTSLSISWDGPGMAEETRPHIATVAASSLAAIGTISSLQQLRLCAGQEFGWRCQWLVDHDNLRTNLRGLQDLRKLALSRDTYPIGAYPDVEEYYSAQAFFEEHEDMARERPALDVPEDWLASQLEAGEDRDELIDSYYGQLSMSSKEIWELAHRNRMLREAERYATIFPKLEWIFCGQRPMSIETSSNSDRPVRTAVPLNKERDTCTTLMRQMFAMSLGWDDT